MPMHCASSLRPKLAMTQREFEATRVDSSVRRTEAEGFLVGVMSRHPYPLSLALAGAVAHAAVANMDYELHAFARDPKPFVYFVYECERRFVEMLAREYPATDELAQEARALVDYVLSDATCDEVAAAALDAAKHFANTPEHLRHSAKPPV